MTYGYKDEYGTFEIEAEVEEGGLFFQWRRYVGSPRINKLGGRYANYCENGQIKFYKSDYIRTRAYPKFVEENTNGHQRTGQKAVQGIDE